MDASRSKGKNAVERLAGIFAMQNEGLSKEEREKRITALENIASSARAQTFQIFRASSPKTRIASFNSSVVPSFTIARGAACISAFLTCSMPLKHLCGQLGARSRSGRLPISSVNDRDGPAILDGLIHYVVWNGRPIVEAGPHEVLRCCFPLMHCYSGRRLRHHFPRDPIGYGVLSGIQIILRLQIHPELR
jgi:hypothetical protein